MPTTLSMVRQIVCFLCDSKYRESIKAGNAVYFAKRTGHLKMRYSRIVSLSEHNKRAKLHFQCGENLRESDLKCPVRSEVNVK